METARYVVGQIGDGATTRQIHDLVCRYLKRCHEPTAVARYTLKDAMRRLGPAGYDFEVFIAEVLRAYGYQTELPDLIPGMCVEHEVDVVARRDQRTAMVECKYRNAPGLHVHLKDVMATWARYGDLTDAYQRRRHRIPFTECWVVTNTKITGDGLRFGTCKGMRLIGWQYPATDGLERMIEEKHLYPITVLSSVSPAMQQRFSAAGVMLCHDLTAVDAATLARRTGLPPALIERARRETVEVLRC